MDVLRKLITDKTMLKTTLLSLVNDDRFIQVYGDSAAPTISTLLDSTDITTYEQLATELSKSLVAKHLQNLNSGLIVYKLMVANELSASLSTTQIPAASVIAASRTAPSVISPSSTTALSTTASAISASSTAAAAAASTPTANPTAGSSGPNRRGGRLPPLAAAGTAPAPVVQLSYEFLFIIDRVSRYASAAAARQELIEIFSAIPGQHFGYVKAMVPYMNELKTFQAAVSVFVPNRDEAVGVERQLQQACNHLYQQVPRGGLLLGVRRRFVRTINTGYAALVAGVPKYR
jgi:hypothetical protein